ncbi:type IV toxin-antitoxin system AbiEi family antitoxin domain-containing protein [Mycobacteroides abscessus]|uniref:type IV toxin-antitoxin system AbiEi family antitoxin domain-containing protein n=1 Tax=Mycobacteroides abscessus TaxID=36809 RepID=UPI00078E9C2E|nr:type IV toxin-antitoxin system AbiEi family antitoxin domain-containing protein [Mycobacteroides abscessus]AMU21554.1 hypothetical protein A3N95_12595 [Mycobacteroides abscessus]SHZ07165.1 cullin, a subunit of E3 ubiquitin ligase [Mycobacteroides abscessus subsp. bolletii]SHZ33557.1 cullin, a subunit of E3 ubiquitin ligase [Mycobacteroides abscessus subsp. bolletii]
MHDGVAELLAAQSGVVTYQQLLSVVSRRMLQELVECGALQRVWRGVYSREIPDCRLRLCGLDLLVGRLVVPCLGMAAQLYGFDTERSDKIHILQPEHSRLRDQCGLCVHRRSGAPTALMAGRHVTAPAWTAIEVCRGLSRPRALATLDAALRSGHCRRSGLESTVRLQAGRRGITRVRELLPRADGRAESPMESEARLVMLDAGLPIPELQHEINGWRVDFAWPDIRLAAEYDSDEWHTGATAMRRDKARIAGLQRAGWTVVPITVDDVRRTPAALISRLSWHLAGAA